MTRIPKELTKPIKEKDPEKIASEKIRRLTKLKEVLGITKDSTDSEFLSRMIDAFVMQLDERGGQKGLRIKPALSNLQLLVKISFLNKSGRAKNQEDAAQSCGMKRNKFKKLREKHKDQWRYIQEKMSGYSKQEKAIRKSIKEILAKISAEKQRLSDYRNSLIAEKDKLDAQEIDRIAVLDDQILLYEILIAEQDDLCRQLQDLAETDIEKIITELAEQHLVVPQ